jgi:uncharacterized protein (DUF1800 family)
MADLTPISTWTPADVQHFARRAGFGVTPEAAAALAAQPAAQAIAGWIDGIGTDPTLLDAVLADRADPVEVLAIPARTDLPGAVDVPAVPGPHRYMVDGVDSWRNDLPRAQALCAFRMQYAPYSFGERMALFWHNVFATANNKVNGVAMMLKQQAMFRAHGLDRFDDLLVSVSKDPAMCLWLDSVLNDASGSKIPNENYAREVMELYSLGADAGYSQVDITQLARALSGWSYTVRTADLLYNPAVPVLRYLVDATFALYDGGPNPDGLLFSGEPGAVKPAMHAGGTITFLGRTFDLDAPPAGMTSGEDALRSIVTSRADACAHFLARRLLTHFVTASFTSTDLDDVAAMIQANAFDIRAVTKALLASRYFFDPSQRFALVEGPVSWVVRAARMLTPGLAVAAAAPATYPAWYLVGNAGPQFGNGFDQLGMRLLDPLGPDGWKEDRAWLSSNTLRFRTKLAAALTLGEVTSFGAGSYTLFPNSAADWFPTAPTTPGDVLARLLTLLQPAPIPQSVRAAWLASLWPGAFSWDATGQLKARELAYLILCSPAAQLY